MYLVLWFEFKGENYLWEGSMLMDCMYIDLIVIF